MPHNATSVALMKYPTKRLGEIICTVHRARDEMHQNVPCILPVLDGEMLDINVAGSLGWHTSIDHVDRGLIVHPDRSGLLRGEAKLLHDSPALDTWLALRHLRRQGTQPQWS